MASRRRYLTIEELEEYADITVSDNTEGDDRISQAEELIDGYVGYQKKFFEHDLKGRASAGSSTSITLQQNQQNIYDIDYFKLCEIEIIGGTGAGQRRVCTASTLAGVLTVDSAWTTTPDSTSFYRIYQLGKFPRFCDGVFYSEQTPSTYYKNIPEAVKRATAAQVEYMINMGDDFFRTDKSEKVSERIGDYAYENANTGISLIGPEKLIAPKAKLLLRGIKSRIGRLLG